MDQPKRFPLTFTAPNGTAYVVRVQANDGERWDYVVETQDGAAVGSFTLDAAGRSVRVEPTTAAHRGVVEEAERQVETRTFEWELQTPHTRDPLGGSKARYFRDKASAESAAADLRTKGVEPQVRQRKI